MKSQKINPVFVEFIPEHVEDETLYISDEYNIAVHLCCCGCSEKVVTPLSPVDWQYKKGPNGVSLSPSIGNWDYGCRSHYVIRNNSVIWANDMSDAKIKMVKQRDYEDKQTYIAQRNKMRNRSWLSDLFTSVVSFIKNFIGR